MMTNESKISEWELHDDEDIISSDLYRIYEEHGILRLLNTIKNREIDLDWEMVWSVLVYIQESKQYHKGWLVYKLEEVKAPLEVWQQLALYLEYQLGWAYYRFIEMESGDSSKHNDKAKTKSKSPDKPSKPRSKK
jgi:hypothetical protein